MIGSSILVLLLLVAVGGMVFMNRSNNPVVAENSTTTAMAATVTPLPSPSPEPDVTDTPVPFSATTITDFAPVDDINPVYAHTLAETSFDLTTNTGMNDTDIERLSLRGTTPAPVDDEPEAPNATLPIISLVRADAPAPGTNPGQSNIIRLRPADPGLSFPAEVWPLSTEPTDTPTLTLTLYVDEEPTAFSFQVALQEQTVSGTTEERKIAQAADFIAGMVEYKPAAFLWQMPEQAEDQKVVVTGGHAVVFNDDRVYLLAATETHYQVFVIAAADLASQGQSGWIRREYIDGGETNGDDS